MKRRLIVVPLIRRADGRYLFIKMPLHRGVFPGQWGLPGGGVEEGERIEDAPVINEEFDAFAWFAPDECDRYDMNEETRITLRQVGVRTQ